MQTTPAAQRAVGLSLGAVILGLLVVLAVALPKAEGATGVADLPSTLPGGWTATDAIDPADAPEGSTVDDEAIERQADQTAYAEKKYAEVYDPAPHYRAYIDESFQKYALVTVFSGESSAFLPDTPPVDAESIGAERSGTDLVREGDALCSVAYQLVQAGQDAGDPTAVTCQQPVAGQTIQIQTQGVSVDDTFALLATLADEVA